jgi:hypothetical protein
LTERGWAQIRAALGIIAAVEEEWASELGRNRIEHLRETLMQLSRLTG